MIPSHNVTVLHASSLLTPTKDFPTPVPLLLLLLLLLLLPLLLLLLLPGTATSWASSRPRKVRPGRGGGRHRGRVSTKLAIEENIREHDLYLALGGHMGKFPMDGNFACFVSL